MRVQPRKLGTFPPADVAAIPDDGEMWFRLRARVHKDADGLLTSYDLADWQEEGENAGGVAPGGGGTGAVTMTRESLGTVALANNTVQTLALSEAIVAGSLYEFELFSGSGTTRAMPTRHMFSGDAFLELGNDHAADPPASHNRSMRMVGGNPTAGITGNAVAVANLWRGAGGDDQNLYVNHSRGGTAEVRLFKLVFAGGAAVPGNGAGLTESEVDARVRAGVHNWAETTNADRLPLAKAPSGLVRQSATGTAVHSIRALTQVEYDAIAPAPDANTLYLITG